MTGDQVTSESSAREPLCPNCRESLRGNLLQERVVPESGTAVAVSIAVPADGPGVPSRRPGTSGPRRSKRWRRPRIGCPPEGRFQIAEIGTHEMLLERGGGDAAMWAAFTGEAELVADRGRSRPGGLTVRVRDARDGREGMAAVAEETEFAMGAMASCVDGRAAR